MWKTREEMLNYFTVPVQILVEVLYLNSRRVQIPKVREEYTYFHFREIQYGVSGVPENFRSLENLELPRSLKFCDKFSSQKKIYIFGIFSTCPNRRKFFPYNPIRRVTSMYKNLSYLWRWISNTHLRLDPYKRRKSLSNWV